MIKIEFEQINKGEILIFGIDEGGVKKEIGKIFTPSGSAENHINAIQICGFDYAFDYWGCGVYGDKTTNKMKKDIQVMWWDSYDKMNREEMEKIELDKTNSTPTIIQKLKRFDIGKDSVCNSCYNYPCSCESKIIFDNPYIVKREQDLHLNTKEDFEESVKNKIINKL